MNCTIILLLIVSVYARPQTSKGNENFAANRDALAAVLSINDDTPEPVNSRVKRHFGFDSQSNERGYFYPGYYNPGYYNPGYNQGYFRYGSSEERFGGSGSW